MKVENERGRREGKRKDGEPEGGRDRQKPTRQSSLPFRWMGRPNELCLTCAGKHGYAERRAAAVLVPGIPP